MAKEIIKGSDVILTATLSLNDVDKNIDSEIEGLKIELYDCQNTLIEKFSYPAATGYVTIPINSGVGYLYLDGSKTTDKATGSILFKEYIEKSDVNFTDNTYDQINEQNWAYLK